MLPTLDLMDEISNIVFVIFVAPITIEIMDVIVGPLLVFLHCLHGVEELIASFECATDLVRGHDDSDEGRLCLLEGGRGWSVLIVSVVC